MKLRQPSTDVTQSCRPKSSFRSQGCFARQPEEICSLYEGEDSQDEPETTTGDVFMQPEPAPDPQAEPAIASLSLSTTAA